MCAIFGEQKEFTVRVGLRLKQMDIFQCAMVWGGVWEWPSLPQNIKICWCSETFCCCSCFSDLCNAPAFCSDLDPDSGQLLRPENQMAPCVPGTQFLENKETNKEAKKCLMVYFSLSLPYPWNFWVRHLPDCLLLFRFLVPAILFRMLLSLVLNY